MKVLAIGASTSSASINRQLALHAASLVPGADVTDLDLRTLEAPMFSVDLEEQDGIPEAAQRFLDTIRAHDAIVISLAEHNGSYSAAFKNLYDWTSRIEYRLWSDKPMLLLATSPGERGASGVLALAGTLFPRMGAEVRATFSLPSFQDHFADGKITDSEMAADLAAAASKLAAS